MVKFQNVSIKLKMNTNPVFFSLQFCDVSPRKMSYGELRDRMGRWGAFLQKKGLGKGSVVAVVSPNTVDLVAVQYGSIGCGAIYCGINPLCSVGELKELLHFIWS